ncbi:hypothetical protein SO694_00021218 [Aureococcus anophagefferens]|uniref:Uncharacterized protein n=1 Tax=Aureococcus anophagefferens TaxID=44056 RepID=A0ABR1FUL0_AURAN
MVQKICGKRGRPAKTPKKGPWRPTPPDGKSLKDVAGTVEDLKWCCDLVHDEKLKATVVAKRCWDERKRYVSRDKIEHWTKKHKGAARGGTPWKDLHTTPTRGPTQKMGVGEEVLLCAVVLATMRGFGFTRAASSSSEEEDDGASSGGTRKAQRNKNTPATRRARGKSDSRAWDPAEAFLEPDSLSDDDADDEEEDDDEEEGDDEDDDDDDDDDEEEEQDAEI